MHVAAKRSSFIFLSLLCFALADVRDGPGPFFGVYLQSQGWYPDEIGYAMTAGGFSGLICSTPLGALADHTYYKRLLLAFSVLIIVISFGVNFILQGAFSAACSKIFYCAAAAAIMPTLTGITLGLTGQKAFTMRLGVNEAWSHAGNAGTALLGGAIGYFYGIPGVFAVMAVMGTLAIFCAWRINQEDMDYATARGLDEPGGSFPSAKGAGFRALFSNGPLMIVSIKLFFFHFGNASLLPLLGQSAVAKFDFDPAVYTASSVVLAQMTMILTALWGARKAEIQGYGLLFYLALLALPARGLIAGCWLSPWNILPVRLLDGVGAGLLGVATPDIVARILEGSGHVNMGLGFALTQGIGAALSNAYGGFFARHIGYDAAFLALAIAPRAGLACIVIGEGRLPRLRDALRGSAPNGRSGHLR